MDIEASPLGTDATQQVGGPGAKNTEHMENDSVTSVSNDGLEERKEVGHSNELEEADLVIDEDDYELDEDRSDSGVSNNLADSGIDTDVESRSLSNVRIGDSALPNYVKEHLIKSAKKYKKDYTNNQGIYKTTGGRGGYDSSITTKEGMIREGLIAEDALRGIMCALCGYEAGWRGFTRITRHMEGKHSIGPGYPCPMPMCAYVSRTKDDCQKHCWLRHQKKLSYRGLIPRNPHKPDDNPSARGVKVLKDHSELEEEEETLASESALVNDVKGLLTKEKEKYLSEGEVYYDDENAQGALCCLVSTCDVQDMLYTFPIEQEKHNAWLKAIGRKGRNYRPEDRRICGDHFKTEDFVMVEGTEKPTLILGALPTLFLGRRKPRERCIVDNCDSGDGDAVTIHRWTAMDAVTHEKWLTFCGPGARAKVAQSTRPEILNVCSRHFEKEDYKVQEFGNGKYLKLKDNVVPSIRVADSSQSSKDLFVPCATCGIVCKNTDALKVHMKFHPQKRKPHEVTEVNLEAGIEVDRSESHEVDNAYDINVDPLQSSQKIIQDAQENILHAQEFLQNPHNGIEGSTKIVTRDGDRLKGGFQCNECEYKTDEGSNMRGHIRRVHERILDDKNYNCNLCDFASKDNFHLANHLKNVHPIRSEEEAKYVRVKMETDHNLSTQGAKRQIDDSDLQEEKSPGKRQKLSAPYNDMRKKPNILRRSRVPQEGNKQELGSYIPCNICGTTFSFIGSLKAHMKMYHENHNAKPSSINSRWHDRNRTCCVAECKPSRDPRYKFPKNIEMRKLWLKVCNLSSENLLKDPRVCSKHFKLEDLAVKGSNHLSKDAVPSLHLPHQDPLFISDELSEQGISSIAPAAISSCSFCDKFVPKDEYLIHFKVKISFFPH